MEILSDSICIVLLELAYYQLQRTTLFQYSFHKWDSIMWFRMFSFICEGSLTMSVCVCVYVHICACMDAYRIHNNSEQDIQSKFKFPFEHQIFGIFYCLGFNANELKFCVPSSLNICPYTLNTHLQSILTWSFDGWTESSEENFVFSFIFMFISLDTRDTR